MWWQLSMYLPAKTSNPCLFRRRKCMRNTSISHDAMHTRHGRNVLISKASQVCWRDQTSMRWGFWKREVSFWPFSENEKERSPLSLFLILRSDSRLYPLTFPTVPGCQRCTRVLWCSARSQGSPAQKQSDDVTACLVWISCGTEKQQRRQA